MVGESIMSIVQQLMSAFQDIASRTASFRTSFRTTWKQGGALGHRSIVKIQLRETPRHCS
jgi:hypothetical protein